MIAHVPETDLSLSPSLAYLSALDIKGAFCGEFLPVILVLFRDGFVDTWERDRLSARPACSTNNNNLPDIEKPMMADRNRRKHRGALGNINKWRLHESAAGIESGARPVLPNRDRRHLSGLSVSCPLFGRVPSVA